MKNQPRDIKQMLSSPRPISGGAPDETIVDALARVAEMSSEELDALQARIEARAGELADATSDEQFAELQQLADGAKAIRTQRASMASAAERRSQLMSDITPPAADPAPAGDPAPAEPTPAEPSGDPAPATDPAPAEPTPAEPTTDPAPAEPAPADPAQTASGRPAAPANRPQPGDATPPAGGATPAPVSQANPPSIVAAGDVPGFSSADPLTFEQLGQAFAEKAHAVQGSTLKGKALVASIHFDYPEDRALTKGDAEGNYDKIMDAVTAAAQVEMDALVAAGGLCAPVDVRYDLENISTTARPLRDSLVRFGANRGGIRFIEPPVISDLAGAIGIWTELNDQAPGTDQGNPVGEQIATKPCLTITCGDEVQVVVDAITQCLTVGNFSRRTFPEQFARFWQLAMAAHARKAEDRLFAKLAANSTAVTSAKVFGAARDLLESVRRAATAYRSRHRMSPEAVLRYVAPAWVRDMVAADLSRQQPGDNALSVAYAEVDGFFRDANVAVTWVLDGNGQYFAAQGAAAILAWPATVKSLLFHEGAHIYLDGGTLDLGTEIRDTSNIETNDVEAFTETFESTAFVGIESLSITHTVCVNGETQAAQDAALCP